MLTEELADGEHPQVPDAFGDSWASVFIDIYEKLKARGELPDGDDAQADAQASAPVQDAQQEEHRDGHHHLN